MGAAYSQDLRDRVLAAYDRGMVNQPDRRGLLCLAGMGPADQAGPA